MIRIIITLFTAIRSKAFVSDFKTFFETAWTFIRYSVGKLLELAKWASQLGDMIPQETIALIVHWIILTAVVVLISGIVLLLLFIVCDTAYHFYYYDYADQISLAVLLISLAAVVFFAEQIRSVLPINLLLLLILTHAVYVGVRYFIIKHKRGY
jgi:hypothetical protein